MGKTKTFSGGSFTGSSGHLINNHGIPEKCPKCRQKLETYVKNHDPMWGDGDVCCTKCDHKIRDYDSG